MKLDKYEEQGQALRKMIGSNFLSDGHCIAAFGRECAAEAYEDAARIASGETHFGPTKIVETLKKKASDLRPVERGVKL